MSIVLVVATPKGGSGKTTLSVLMAHVMASTGMTVQLVDADPQRSLAQWHAAARQSGQDLTNISVTVADNDQALLQAMAASAADILVVDLPGIMSRSLHMVVARANLLVIPSRASGVDLKEVAKLLAYLEGILKNAAPLRYCCVLNAVEGIEVSTTAFKEAVAFGRANGIEMARVLVKSRPIYKRLLHGEAVSLSDGSQTAQKAFSNIGILMNELFERASAGQEEELT
jgi:chromosome partitioning protein